MAASRPASRASSPITQFDGGPLGNVNCTMASGAMLARLGYGIVTTGSQLRALQPDQEGGTSLADLQVAIKKWGVAFNQGAISPLQLRALLYAGAGAVIQVNYGMIPVALRLQKNFTGGHAIYVDGFRPAGTDGPAAYFVIDPLGPTWAGYKGAWWPADVVEAAGARLRRRHGSTRRGRSRAARRRPTRRRCRPAPSRSPPRRPARRRRRPRAAT